MHLRVPVHKTPAASLIEKPLVPRLEAAAKDTDQKNPRKTIKPPIVLKWVMISFDEVVTNFLVKIGEPNIISITTLTLPIWTSARRVDDGFWRNGCV